MTQCRIYLLILIVSTIAAPIHSVWAQTGCNVTVDLGEDLIFCEGNQNIPLSAQITGNFLDVQWEPLTGLSNPTQPVTQAAINNTITYTLSVRSRSNVSLIVNGDFSQGDSGFTSNYEYGTGGSFGLLSTEGQYAIDDNPADAHRRFANCGDHTTGNGNMMIVNASGQEDSFWCQSVMVNGGATYDFSAWVASVNDENPAQLQFSIDGLLLGNQFNASSTLCAWQEFSAQWVAAATATVEICIVNVNLTPAGNDFAIDDISFREICQTSDSLTITVADLNADWDLSSPICQNDSVIILNDLLQPSASPGGTWRLNGQTISLLDPSTLNPGQYLLDYAVNLESCVENNEQTISVQKAPYAGTPPPILRYCEGTAATLILADQLDGEDPGGVWTQTSSVPAPAGSFDPISSRLEIARLPAGDYRFLYTVGANGLCDTDESEVRVIIDALPIVDLGADRALDCIDATLILSSLAGQNAGYDYQWTDNNGNILGAAAQLTVDAADTYVLEVTDRNSGCRNRDSVNISENTTTITALVAVTPPTCYGSEDGQILVTSPEGGTEPYLYSINNRPFVSNPEFRNLSPGNYSLVVMDAGGCTELFEVAITAPNELEVVIVADRSVINLGDSLQLEAVINDRVSEITWTPTPQNCPDCTTITVAPALSTRYVVEVRDEFGCSAGAQLDILVKRDFRIFVPTAFSPNEDGVNDLFYVNAAAGIRIRHIAVVDRWGNVVFQRRDFDPNDPGSAWDGRFRGNLVASGIVVYAIEAALPNGELITLRGELAVIY